MCTAAAICCRIAVRCILALASVTITSRREIASRGLLACTVVSDPSWPVFMACSMSSASSPRTSPTMMRSGRMRRLLTSSCRCRTAPWPSRFAGRVSRRARCGCFNCSSAASSMVTIRSLGEMKHGERIQQRGLPRARAARDDDVQPRRHRGFEQSHHAARQRTARHQVVRHQLVGAEAADREQRAVHRQRRDDGVDARAVGQARIHHGIRFVHAPPHLRDDLVDDPQQVRHRRGTARWSAPAALCARRRPGGGR